ncbi:hypothetical protein [Lichenibacterium dinghuense]|uniref:hypothetical protein n=1 Tax=Lichenibacterium dinghuense TaxID=2895977 RepID=UPI001F17CF03|nr:hypothetical protein [Lichenibacterium sp. 6Y81]
MRRPAPPSGRIPRARVHIVPRGLIGGLPSNALLSQVREHTELGERVRLHRFGYRAFDVVRNGDRWLVLPVVGRSTPIGTFDNVWAALAAGDAYIEAVRRGEFDEESDDGDPRGAA